MRQTQREAGRGEHKEQHYRDNGFLDPDDHHKFT